MIYQENSPLLPVDKIGTYFDGKFITVTPSNQCQSKVEKKKNKEMHRLRGFLLQVTRLDDGTSETLSNNTIDYKMNYQMISLSIHQQNVAKRAIKT